LVIEGIASAANRSQDSVVLGLAATLPPQFALAEDAYPSRPIHVIVGFTPGAAADITARVLIFASGGLLAWWRSKRKAQAVA
jgi:hypothetical protein